MIERSTRASPSAMEMMGGGISSADTELNLSRSFLAGPLAGVLAESVVLTLSAEFGSSQLRTYTACNAVAWGGLHGNRSKEASLE
jgi:hypothetical protein